MRRLWQFLQKVLGIIFRHPVPGVCIIATQADNQIILVRRQDNQRWSLPGGMIDWGENILTTVRRELKEETGLDLVKIERLVGVYSAADRDPRIHSICISVKVTVAGELKVQDQMEIGEVRAFQFDHVPLDQLAHDHQQQLQNYFQGLTTIA